MQLQILWVVVAAVLAMSGIQAITRIVIAITTRSKSAPPRALEEMAQKIERINQTVEATAIEVERIGESQRFLTRVLSDKPAAQIERGA
jgi:predicted  nucleic acid-binding Zn-ribbon protein